ncbi:MAG: WecB/TagA/CpsF family glycosyltransferase [Candidatus Omnitrophica bacterium]|jgi:N-acetylglucosaminyldiphosphoundecaprenol N-acetyl-beta-D-mannosaminyltransferase|nr:WecB/TagA/CpsF family glycosyltransferase [Candidatus Omnitrophota bacterium]
MSVEKFNKFFILETKISAIDMHNACLFIEEAIAKRRKKYICVCPVSTIMECRRNKKVLNSVNSADLITPDGMPTVWIGRIKGHKNIKRVYGPELMQEICSISVKKGYKHYFYGSSQDTLNQLQKKLKDKYPGLIISGSFSPPFRQLTEEESARIVGEINNSNPDVLWVGLGSPKQDLWMYEYRDKLNAPVLIGVGAAFDFLAGIKLQAPGWIRNNGFEWLFRLMTEPKRLWRRYLVDGSLFVYYVLIELFLNRFRSVKNPSKAD